MMKNRIPLLLFISTVLCGALFLLCFRLGFHLAGDIFLCLFFQLVLMHISAPVIYTVFRMRFNAECAWFKEKRFEARLYSALGVKKWKGRAAVYSPRLLKRQGKDLCGMVMYMCHAELVHELAAFLSPSVFLLLIWREVDILVLIASALIFAAVHLCFAAIQRYNRPRCLRIMKKII